MLTSYEPWHNHNVHSHNQLQLWLNNSCNSKALWWWKQLVRLWTMYPGSDGVKRLWRHIEGTTAVPKLHTLDAGVPVLSDGRTPATEDQIEAKEMKIMDYNKWEYLTQHDILSTTTTHLSTKIKNLKTVDEMWDAVKADVTTKSTLYLLDHIKIVHSDQGGEFLSKEFT